MKTKSKTPQDNNLTLRQIAVRCHRGTDLAKAIQQFSEMYHKLKSPERARGMCEVASLAFMKFLFDKGLITEREWWNNIAPNSIVTGIAKVETRNSKTFFHAWVCYDEVAIDWTYRQFDQQCTFPLMCGARHHPHHECPFES